MSGRRASRCISAGRRPLPRLACAVEGTQSIPVLSLKFRDTGADPIDVAQLQKELFDGPWPTGTMTDFYKEISYGRFEVNGQVLPFKTLKNRRSFYTSTCNGLCQQARVPDMLKETLTLNAGLDWGRFDNDGPDGKPNSGDDDGFVDFVAFVQPNVGGECGDNSSIWSHRFSLSGWNGQAVRHQDSASSGGGTIMVDDYVIMPAKACDGKTMIQIGVFAHEFGHAFGLPDLYDTDDDNGVSEGAGNWCLMAAGSWGGDGNSPERPAHMSAWSKTFLGWVLPSLQTGPLPSASIKDVESNPAAIKVPISTTQYYLDRESAEDPVRRQAPDWRSPGLEDQRHGRQRGARRPTGEREREQSGRRARRGRWPQRSRLRRRTGEMTAIRSPAAAT